MIRLSRLTLALVIILSAILVVTRAIGNTRQSPVAILFTDPDGTACELPCLFGVQLGKTSFENAIALLKAHPLFGEQLTYKENFGYTGSQLISSWSSWRGRGQYEGQELYVELSRDKDGTVSHIGLYVGPSVNESRQGVIRATSLGEITNFLGSPQITLDRNGIIDRIFYFRRNSIVVSFIPVEGRDFLEKLYRPRVSDMMVQMYVYQPFEEKWNIKWCGFTARLCR